MTEFFYQLDVHVEEGKSAQAKMQTKERALANCPSSRSSLPPQTLNSLRQRHDYLDGMGYGLE